MTGPAGRAAKAVWLGRAGGEGADDGDQDAHHALGRRLGGPDGTGAGRSTWAPVPRAAAGQWEWSSPSRHLWLDAAATDLLGGLPRESASQTLDRALPAADRDRVEHLLSTGTEGTFRLRLTSGQVRTLLVRSTLAPLSRDAFAGVIVDVTGLQATSSAASALVRCGPDAFACVDAHLLITAVNTRACEEAGRAAHQLLGRSLAVLVEDGDATGALVRLVQEVVTTGRTLSLDSHVSPAGRACQVLAVPADGGASVWWRDVDDHVRATAASERALVSERRARRAAEEARAVLSHQASSDALTGLANRGELLRRLAGHLSREGNAATVLFIDLDRFKEVNDTLGHAAGDELLAVVSQRLRQLVRASDVVARIGGDEFVVALLDDDTAAAASAAQDVASRVLAALRVPARVAGQDLTATASIGVAVGSPHADVETLLRDADVALYRTKRSGRDGITWFDDDLRRQVVDRQQLEVDLRTATQEGQLSLAYQAGFDLHSGAVIAVEALLRWQHPVRGRVDAAAAIELAEQSGLIASVGSWVVDTAVRDAARWSAVEQLTTWINVSVHQLVKEGFTDDLLVRLARADVPPWRFGVEVTEPALAAGGPAEEEVARLSASGIRVAIDDFGTGFSSLARLARFPVDVLKVDRAFVQNVVTRRGAAVVEGVVTLGHAIGARVVAEGVETPVELARLRDAGCDAALGFLLARPVPAQDVLLSPVPVGLLP